MLSGSIISSTLENHFGELEQKVLAVYAVKTTTDPDNAQEVATMDDEKLELLKDIFWQLNEISFSTSTQTETVIETSDDGHGNIVETETTVTLTALPEGMARLSRWALPGGERRRRTVLELVWF